MTRPQTITPLYLGIAASALVIVAGGVGFGLARLQHTSGSMPATDTAGKGKVLYWYDPMVPAQHFDKPGKSPFMDMQLKPRYAGEADPAEGGVQIDPSRLQNLGVRLASVERGDFTATFDAAGSLDFNGRDVAIIQARANGFVQRVYARAPGDVIAAGAPIADILVPSWGGAQSEYLAVIATHDPSLEAAARQRLVLLGMSAGLIDNVKRTGKISNVVTITTPVGGAIQTLDARQGMTVSMGQTLAQVTSLSSVWLTAAVPEVQAGRVKIGQTVTADLAAFPSETFTGRIAAILPTTQTDSRTLSVRVELPNPGGKLRPGMFATVHLAGNSSQALFVPTEALIRTGKRTLVMLGDGKGRFTPAEVQTGRENGDRTEIIAGLNEGDKVVASGQFLIDSEASLSGINARPLTAMSPPSRDAAAAPALYSTKGVIEQLKGNSITLSHEAVPAIGWPAMTMTFKLSSVNLAKGMKVGDHVSFGFVQKADGPVIQKIDATGGMQ